MGIFSKKKKSGRADETAPVVVGAVGGSGGGADEVSPEDVGGCSCPAHCVIAPLDQDHPNWAAWLEKARELEGRGVAFAPFEGSEEPRLL